MKVLIASDYYPPFVGGVISHIETVTYEFLRMGDEVCVIAPSSNNKSSIKKKGKFTLCEIASFPSFVISDLRFASPFESKIMISMVKKFKPDVIHVHSSLVVGKTISKMAKKFKIPTVGTNHFMPENVFDNLPIPDYVKKIFEKLAWRVMSFHLRHADIVTTPSLTASKYLNTKVHGLHSISISNGIIFSKFRKQQNNPHIFEKLKITKNHKIILFVGRLMKEKRLEILMKALPKILKKIKMTLVIVGRGNHLVDYQKIAREVGVNENVIFTGYLNEDNLLSLYHSSNIFVMPSIAELQSIATLEAMASGLPVVAAKAGALPELVKNGVNGYLFNAGSVESLTKNIIKIFSDKKLMEKMSKNNIEIARTHDITKVAIKFKTLYKEVINRNK